MPVLTLGESSLTGPSLARAAPQYNPRPVLNLCPICGQWHRSPFPQVDAYATLCPRCEEKRAPIWIGAYS